MSTQDLAKLKAEKAEIEARIAAATDSEKPVLHAQFDERLSHLKARIGDGEPPGKKK